MSGAVVAAFMPSGQQPILQPLTLSNSTPCFEAGIGVRWFRNGTVSIGFGCNNPVFQPPMWGGPAPRVDEGDAYQVRCTLLSGQWDNEFDTCGTWITLNDTVPGQASALYVSGGSGLTGSLSAVFEIRRLSTSLVVASATWNFSWVGV